jgi:hypothetical protein
MGNVIGIKISGQNNIVYLPDFVQASNDLLELLAEIDVAMSPKFKSTTNWRLKTLSYASPALLEVEGETKEDQPDNRTVIVDTLFMGIDSLKKNSERPRGFSDKALTITKNFNRLLDNGVRAIEVISNSGSVKYESDILKNVDTILTPGKQMFGSIEGRIERMNSHDEFSFYLYEPILYRRIRCELMDAQDTRLKERIIGFYEKSVIVSGLLFTNINGEVNSVKVRDIFQKEVAPLLTDASEVVGIWDFTDGESPVEHLRRMRNDS